MALCDFLIASDITGFDCENPAVKGAEAMGVLINRSEIDNVTFSDSFTISAMTLKCGGKRAYTITQSGKQPFNGSTQEMQEGTYQNTITNTLQFVILAQSSDVAADVFALANGEFVAIIPDKQGNYQVYGYETGLKCSGAVREYYNDDTLAGWQVTMVEEGAAKGNIFTTSTIFTNLQSATSACE